MAKADLQARADELNLSYDDATTVAELEAMIAAAEEPAASAGNDTIEHSEGGVTTRSDATDLGVPMRPLADGETPSAGPEDALDPTSRGDYSDRLVTGPSVRMAPIPAGDRDVEERTETVDVGDGQEREVRVREPGPNVEAAEAIPGIKTEQGGN